MKTSSSSLGVVVWLVLIVFLCSTEAGGREGDDCKMARDCETGICSKKKCGGLGGIDDGDKIKCYSGDRKSKTEKECQKSMGCFKAVNKDSKDIQYGCAAEIFCTAMNNAGTAKCKHCNDKDLCNSGRKSAQGLGLVMMMMIMVAATTFFSSSFVTLGV